MRTAFYERYSSQLQNARSIEDQVRVCKERAEREGWQITAVFTDFAISGAVRDRQGLIGLVDHIKAGKADQVLTEALDWLSRHQGDMSWLHDHLIHAGARICSLSEGEINELQIGFKDTMAARFLKDIADKIRRGQMGRVAAGRIPGNLAYGYRMVVQLDARGEPELSLREIDPDQAEIVRRIVREYLEGDSARTIARRLNAEGVPSPTRRMWSVSMINGDVRRQSGILRKEI
ncbi:recombinase family protein [Blastomonas sp. RAC04]|uniref:recombinase family protein n=1 Tax=Blastomonas sp. RAC04 TaxID=1842535 RepID=UPI001496107B|nr:recombinase family protein [Blastomonas sp. RAC04]